MPFQLLRDTIPDDVVDALQILLQGAQSGEITGVAFVATLKRSRFVHNTAGFCRRNPTHTRGMVASLDDELGAMMHGRDPGETR